MYYNSNLNQPLTGYRTFKKDETTKSKKVENTKSKKKLKKKVTKNDTIKETEK